MWSLYRKPENFRLTEFVLVFIKVHKKRKCSADTACQCIFQEPNAINGTF